MPGRPRRPRPQATRERSRPDPSQHPSQHPALYTLRPALAPNGRRLEFTSHRGPGTTCAVEGPILGPAAPGLGGYDGLPDIALIGAVALVASRSLQIADPSDAGVESRDALAALPR